MSKRRPPPIDTFAMTILLSKDAETPDVVLVCAIDPGPINTGICLLGDRGSVLLGHLRLAERGSAKTLKRSDIAERVESAIAENAEHFERATEIIIERQPHSRKIPSRPQARWIEEEFARIFLLYGKRVYYGNPRRVKVWAEAAHRNHAENKRAAVAFLREGLGDSAPRHGKIDDVADAYMYARYAINRMLGGNPPGKRARSVWLEPSPAR